MWKNNRFNGWGREIRENGEIYEGKFINDSLTGKGKYKKGNILYIGDFVDYDQHGKGELFTDEYHYAGDFKFMKGNLKIKKLQDMACLNIAMEIFMKVI